MATSSSSTEPTLHSTIERLKKMLEESIEALRIESNQKGAMLEPTSSTRIDHMARFIEASMCTPGRLYHSVHHVFDVVHGMNLPEDAVLVLAALFHDVIYLSIDKELSPDQADFLLEQDPDNHCIMLVRSIFPADTNYTTCNEYLSALVAAKLLRECLSSQHLVQVVACIEASIPFRPNQPMERLYERLSILDSVNQDMNLPFTPPQLIKTVQMAARFANHDLRAFRSPDATYFWSTSWQLLPEWHPALLKSVPRLKDLEDALTKLQHNYTKLPPPEQVFQSFRGEPSKERLEEYCQLARRNIQVVDTYTNYRRWAIRVVVDFVALLQQKEGVVVTPGDDFRIYCAVEEGFLNGARSNTATTRKLTEVETLVLESMQASRTMTCDWDASANGFSRALLLCAQMQPTLIEERPENNQAVGTLCRGLPDPLQDQLGDAIRTVMPKHTQTVAGVGLRK